jgi:polar amino acid transport system substrate-binding protein
MRARYLLPAAAAAAALLLTGCVDNSTAPAAGAPTGSPSAEITVNAEAAALLPEPVSKSGILNIGTSPNYAPNEFKDQAGNPIGWGIELSEAIADRLGLEPKLSVARFETIIPGILSGKLDLGESSFTDNVEREKQVDFVNYFSAGVQWASATGNTVDPDNACGLKIAVQATTFEDTAEIPAKSDACVAAGKEPIQKLPFDTQDAAANAVVLGQADAFSADSPVTLYAIQQLAGKLQLAGETFEVASYGFAVQKDTGMAQAVQLALQSLIDDGSYGKILDAWGVSAGGVTEATINAAGAAA